MSLTGCTWSSLNAPSTETPVLHQFLVESLFLISPLWGNKKWEPQYKDEEVGNIFGQIQLNRLQMVQFECLKH